MAFDVSVTLVDDLGRKTRKAFTSTSALLADALAAMTAYYADLEAVTELGIVEAKLSAKDVSGASAAAANSNVDTGASFTCSMSGGGEAAHHIPGFPISKAIAGGSIPVDDADVVAYFANFLTGGSLRFADGEYVTAILRGQMDK